MTTMLSTNRFARWFASGALVAAAAAQSPLVTTFANDNSGPPGGSVFFDLTVTAPALAIHGLDVNLASPVGRRGTIELWARTGTHVGFETNAAGWTLLAAAPCRAAGAGQRSRCAFTTPVVLPSSLTGIALCGVGLAHAYTNGNGTNLIHSTAELTLRAGAALDTCFAPGALTSPRVANVAIYYGGETLAAAVPIGKGCGPTGAISFYEDFPPGGFDLNGSGWCATTNGVGGYDVAPFSAPIIPPSGTGLALGDDALSAPIPLTGQPCTYPGVGGTTTSIRVCSNGFVHLNPTATSTDPTPTPSELLNGGPRIAAFWTDLVPDGITNVANVYVQAAPNNNIRITWWNVAVAGVGNCSVKVQLTMGPDAANPGRCKICVVYEVNCAGTLPRTLVGVSPGAGNRDPGNRDISGGGFQTQNDVYPISDDVNRVPNVGTTPNIEVANMPINTLAGVLVLGNTAPPIDLGAIGAPECFLYVSIAVTLAFPVSGTSASVPLSIPNSANLVGSRVTTQAAVLAPGLNPLALGTANALELTLGDT